MIDLIEVEKERLLDEVSFLWVLFYFMSIDRPAAPTQCSENLGLLVKTKWREISSTAQSDGMYWVPPMC